MGCLYKIISKTLAVRLSKVLEEVISDTQSVFLRGRHILNGVVILNEVIDEARKKKLSRVVFKVDFEKAYDSVDWNYLNDMLVGMKFE